MTFYFFDDVLLLYLSLESAKRVLEGLALLQSDFSQTDYTPLLVLNKDQTSYGKPMVPKSSGMYKTFTYNSKQQFQSHLYQSWCICTIRLHEIRRLLIIGWIGEPAIGFSV